MSELLSAMVIAKGDGEKARVAFIRAGFDAGPLVGTTFSITAPRSRFKEMLGSRLDEMAAPEGLGPSALPTELKRFVAGITFSAPLDFGPPDY